MIATYPIAIANTSANDGERLARYELSVHEQIQGLLPSHQTPELTLVGLIAPGWTVVQPILLNVETDADNSVVVSDEIFMVYGVGNTVAEALFDYATSLIELYELLAQSAETNPFDGPQLAILQTYLSNAN